MRLFKQSVELWKQGSDLASIYDHIARCTRVCYQSEKITKGESSLEFLKRTIFPRNHFSVLEHGTVYLIIPNTVENKPIIDWYITEPYSKIVNRNDDNGDNWYVTTNMRVIVENDVEDDLKNFISTCTEHHYKRLTLSMITNIGVSRELNRYRTHSISEESTRYCNYTKAKFNGGVGFIIPTDYDIVINPTGSIPDNHVRHLLGDCKVDVKMLSKEDYFINFLIEAETAYNITIDAGGTVEDARRVLPLCTKTQVVHTAFIDDWCYFLLHRLRETTGKVHPDMKELALKINDIIVKYENP